MSATESFDELRRQAVDGTRHELSAELLGKFPRLVAHPGASGLADLHYQDYDLGGAICSTASEAMLLYELARLACPLDALEIGSYVGWSTAHIARATPVTCIDPMTEVERRPVRPAARFWENIDRCGLSRRVRLIHFRSPEALPMLAPRAGWDFVFLDGHHQDGQPERDVLGLMPFLAPHALVVLHDMWLPGVQAAARLLMAAAWQIRVLPTANYLSVAWQMYPEWWDEFCGRPTTSAYALPEAERLLPEKVRLQAEGVGGRDV